MKLELEFELQEDMRKHLKWVGVYREFIAETEMNNMPVAVYSHVHGIDIQLEHGSSAGYRVYTLKHQDLFNAIQKALNNETNEPATES